MTARTTLDLRAVFLSEAEDNLDKLEEALRALPPHTEDEDGINALFRTAHNLKGSAHTAGFPRVGELAHVLEELLDRWRDLRLSPSRAQIEWATQAIDALRAELKAEATGEADDEHGAGHDGTAAVAQTNLRVSGDSVDRMVDLVTQVMMDRSRQQVDLEATGTTAQRDGFERAAHVYSDLRDAIYALRLSRVEPLMTRLERSARDVARKLGKDIDVHLEGTHSTIDAVLVDKLKDPLNHMIRNAVDHGIERADLRAQRGKSTSGQVRLRAYRQAGAAVFELSDDGGGLPRAKIVAKARERGRDVTEETLTDEDLATFIFEPGFSTAERVDDISGRGVGMDVVKRNIEQLRGSIRVQSREGHGTTFTIRVPLSMAVLDGVLVSVGGQHFLVPSDVVEECIEGRAVTSAGRERVHHADTSRVRTAPSNAPSTSAASPSATAQHDVIDLRGTPVSRISLRRALEVRDAPPPDPRHSPALVVRNGDQRFALAVDHIHGTHQTVLESLGPLFRDQRPLAGVSVLGSGEVALVLDTDALLHRLQAA